MSESRSHTRGGAKSEEKGDMERKETNLVQTKEKRDDEERKGRSGADPGRRSQRQYYPYHCERDRLPQ